MAAISDFRCSQQNSSACQYQLHLVFPLGHLQPLASQAKTCSTKHVVQHQNQVLGAHTSHPYHKGHNIYILLKTN